MKPENCPVVAPWAGEVAVCRAGLCALDGQPKR
jgi:hypothetical protein